MNRLLLTVLAQRTRNGIGLKIPANRRQEEVTILDRFEDTANVKIVAADWIDYLQMAKFDGDWKIINVLWALKPKPAESAP
jgi:hypothetical protein